MATHKLQLTTLQAGRAIAAIMVVLFHIEIFIFPDRLYPGQGAFKPFEIGYSGVEFFFALSGLADLSGLLGAVYPIGAIVGCGAGCRTGNYGAG